MTKEELQKENTLLKSDNERLGLQEVELRRDICKALGFTYKDKSFGYESEEKVSVRSWAQIFVHIGKLLERQKRLSYVEDIEQYRLESKEVRLDVEELKRVLKDYGDAGTPCKG